MILGVLVLLPIGFAAVTLWDNWQGVMPSFDGGYYYYAREREVIDGHAFVGNPFAFEHKDDAPAYLFLVDWPSVLPAAIKSNINFVIVWNALFWPLIFLLCVYALARYLGASKNYSLLVTLISYLSCYDMLLRAQTMQIVLPLFVLFLLVAIRLISEPNRRNSIYFVLVTALCAYSYTYLAQAVMAFCGLFILIVLWKKYPEKKRIITTLSIALASTIPLLIYMRYAASLPDYSDMMLRVGLLKTHLPSGKVYIIGIWTIGLILLTRFTNISERTKHFAWATSLSIFAVAASNVVTGLELENAPHAERFLIAWVVIFAMIEIPVLLKKKNLGSVAIFVVIIGVLGASIWSHFAQIVYARERLSMGILEQQKLAGVLNFLEKDSQEPTVVWSTDYQMLDYIPVDTKHYMLFGPSQTLYRASDGEIQERYLVNNFFNNLSVDDIKNDLRIFGGVGYAFHQEELLSREKKYCGIVKICDADYVPKSIDYAKVYDLYAKDIRPNIDKYLDSYHVSYIVRGKDDANFVPSLLKGLKLVYSDRYYEVYQRL